jgi:hypothetical protein
MVEQFKEQLFELTRVDIPDAVMTAVSLNGEQ